MERAEFHGKWLKIFTPFKNTKKGVRLTWDSAMELLKDAYKMETTGVRLDTSGILIIINYAWDLSSNTKIDIICKAIDEWYSQMGETQRNFVFKSIVVKKVTEELQSVLISKYKPHNEYAIRLHVHKQYPDITAFLHDGKYYIYSNQYLSDEDIQIIKHVNPKK